jgi:DNA-directed RNA polymerase subunit RPC12/RpoP
MPGFRMTQRIADAVKKRSVIQRHFDKRENPMNPMNRRTQMVRFTCSGCDSRLKSPAASAGRRGRCPECSTRMKVPARSRALAVRPVICPVEENYPYVLPVWQEQATVPLKLAMPKNLGGVETTVSQDTADDVTKVVTGGFMVILGIVVAVILGRRPSA